MSFLKKSRPREAAPHPEAAPASAQYGAWAAYAAPEGRAEAQERTGTGPAAEAAERATVPSERAIVPAADPAEKLLAPEELRELKRRLQTSIANKVAMVVGDPTYEQVSALIADTLETAVRQKQAAAAIALDDDARNQLADYLIGYFTSEFLGLGPIDKLLKDPEITEIMVNPKGLDPVTGKVLGHEVYVEKGGVIIERPDVRFEDDAHVRRIMARIVSRNGRLLDEMHTSADATLFDGSRFSGTVYPTCPDGSTFNIRTFSDRSIELADLLAAGAMTTPMSEFLATAIKAKCNILISGGTGAGKTTLLNALSHEIPLSERIIVLEDTSELKVTIGRPNALRFVSRPPNAEGAGEVTLKQLVEDSLRKRPDRIIIGEVRGPEAEDMLEAMNTGHEGSMTTIHANTPNGALNRLVTLVRQGNAELSEEMIKEKIAEAIDVVVQIQRLPDGTRRLMEVDAVGGYTDLHIQLEPLFRFDRPTAEHRPCGAQPKDLARKIETRGYRVDIRWFMPAGARAQGV